MGVTITNTTIQPKFKSRIRCTKRGRTQQFRVLVGATSDTNRKGSKIWPSMAALAKDVAEAHAKNTASKLIKKTKCKCITKCRKRIFQGKPGTITVVTVPATVIIGPYGIKLNIPGSASVATTLNASITCKRKKVPFYKKLKYGASKF